MTAPLGPGDATRIRRMSQRANYDERFVFDVLDQVPFVTMGVVVGEHAELIPTLAARDGRVLYLHGSRSNGALAAAIASGQITISAVLYDGLRLARSGFESSIAYRSVTVVGKCRAVTGREATRALDLLVDRALRGRASEVRAMSDAERRRTKVIAVDIDEAAGKWSSGPTDDGPEDAALPIWSGVVPARIVHGAPIASVDGAMASGVEFSTSVAQLIEPRGDARVDELRDTLVRHAPSNHRERVSTAALVDRLQWGDDPFSERGDPRHITASALLISARGVVLHRHRILGLWLQPGGHVDGDEHPLQAAQRECREETGISGSPLDGTLFHVDLHQGPRGHTHYDLRYVLVCNGEEPQPAPDESQEVEWLTVDEAQRRAEPALVSVLERLRPLVRAAAVRH
jgi:8-oxo-dGTP pyrophosphatase MutT (NUDIX family)/nitroimidazol reductase NimA-like FMN-containing flavoprotein (pyridoxamine 5'-phosphate oxidase superfamily)